MRSVRHRFAIVPFIVHSVRGFDARVSDGARVPTCRCQEALTAMLQYNTVVARRNRRDLVETHVATDVIFAGMADKALADRAPRVTLKA
jgi:hypothetical protein